MSLRVLETSIHLTDLHTRIPFRFGIATMTRVPHVFVGAEVEWDGKRAKGIAADHLPPKWFDKNPDSTFRQDIEAMLKVIQKANELAKAIPPAGSFFDWWRELERKTLRWGGESGHPPLLTSFGVSLVERAALEAFLKLNASTLESGLQKNILGVRLGDLRPELAGGEPSAFLPSKALRSVALRHTVGLTDPLTEGEIPEAERVRDGLPQSFEACVRTYGLSYFKLKVQGKLEHDLDRLARIWKVIREESKGPVHITLDGNEQFKEVGSFRAFWEKFLSLEGLGEMRKRILFVEQPLHRNVALTQATGRDLKDWKERPPMIIDESDADLSSLPAALEGGYIGTSHKNCKGILKGLANACLIRKLQKQNPGVGFVLSGEDLTNVGPVALLQDLASMAVFGVEHVERNGHHYFPGLSQFPEDARTEIMRHHGDLYGQAKAGWPALRVENGRLKLDSIVNAPLGVAFSMDLKSFRPLDRWLGESLNTYN